MAPEQRNERDRSGDENLEPIDDFVVSEPKTAPYRVYRADVAKARIEARVISRLGPSVQVLILAATCALAIGMLAAVTLVAVGKDLTPVTPLFISYFSILGSVLTGLATFYVVGQNKSQR